MRKRERLLEALVLYKEYLEGSYPDSRDSALQMLSLAIKNTENKYGFDYELSIGTASQGLYLYEFEITNPTTFWVKTGSIFVCLLNNHFLVVDDIGNICIYERDVKNIAGDIVGDFSRGESEVSTLKGRPLLWNNSVSYWGELKRHVIAEEITVQACTINFLPSEHGIGYRATLCGTPGDYQAWQSSGYQDMRGVAEKPASMDAWTLFVIDRMSNQGIRFIEAKDKNNYMKIEGNKWLHKHSFPNNGNFLSKIMHTIKGWRI